MRTRFGWILRLLPAILFLLLAGRSFAAQSLILAPGVTGTFADPAQTAQQAWRLEFQLHDFGFPPTNNMLAKVVVMDGSGLYIALNLNLIWVLSNRDGAQCLLPLSGRTNVFFRIQRDPAHTRLSCEEWNYDGSGYVSAADTLQHPVASTASGAQIGSLITVARIAFLHFFDSLLTDGSKPSESARGNLLNANFEGNTLDTSGLSRNLTVVGASYVPTPNQGSPTIPKHDFFLQ